MDAVGIDVSLGEVAASLVLVAVAIGVSLWRRTGLEDEIAVAVLRSFVQLMAIGYVIQAIFDEDSLLLVFALIAVMVVFGAFTARRRARRVPGALWPLLIALGVAGAATLALVVALGVFEPEPRYLVPVGGMVIGNSMTAAAVALNRLGDEMTDRAREIEATLALGATATVAAAPEPAPQPALGDDRADRLDQDHRADLLPRDDGRDAARRRRSDRRRAPAADPALGAARQRRALRPDRHLARLPQLLHLRAPAPRAARAVAGQRCGRIQPLTRGKEAAPVAPGANCSEIESIGITLSERLIGMNSH